MNPPLREKDDCEALIEGLCDGSIDCIATDHAPHTAADKQKGAMGIVGMETAFPVLYTKLVREGRVPLERIADAMCVRPREIFRLPASESLIGIELGTPYTLRASDFATMGRNTPFDEWTVWGRVLHDFD